MGASRPGRWNSVRLQVGAGGLLSVVMPWIVRVQTAQRDADLLGLEAAVIGTSAALLAGYYAFRRLTRYPGIRASYHILPSFAAAYGLVLAFFFFTRLDYSRLQFLASFLICIIWFYIVYFKLQRQKLLRIGVVPFGAVDHLYKIKEVEWIRFSEAEPVPSEVDIIVADLRADIPDRWERLLADCALRGTMVMHVKQLQETLTGRVAIEHLAENTLGSLIPGIVYAKVKRAGDLVVSIFALPFLTPFLLLVAVAIRLESRGPVLFRQERMGYRGELFSMYKFRSMTDRPGVIEEPRLMAMTRDDDKRVTRLGKYLRRYRIDELPQIINIIKGEMSWIGPRPEAAALSLWYEAELPFYRYRHIVRPGITGWAQVKQGHVTDVGDVLEKLNYDFYYIKNFAFWLDLLIVAGTIRTVLSGFGSR